jgi:hypothetical protein
MVQRTFTALIQLRGTSVIENLILKKMVFIFEHYFANTSFAAVIEAFRHVRTSVPSKTTALGGGVCATGNC